MLAPHHADQAAQLSQRFQNPIVAETNARVVLTEPFDEACAANSHSPELDHMVADLRCMSMGEGVCARSAVARREGQQ